MDPQEHLALERQAAGEAVSNRCVQCTLASVRFLLIWEFRIANMLSVNCTSEVFNSFQFI